MSTAETTVTLGPLRAEDRERVRAMVEATRVFRSDEITVALEVFDDHITRPGTDYHAIGAFDDDGLVGFTLYGPTPCTAATWDLYWIVVAPAAHRHGVGRKLMDHTERNIRMRKGLLIVVETSSRDDYGPTRGFYDSIGYTRAAHIVQYYGPQDDLIVYTKHLDPPAKEMAHHG
jgi:ribosomal protein S18 acetylase RimI-like enzyme